jgi:hypothetical protein
MLNIWKILIKNKHTQLSKWKFVLKNYSFNFYEVINKIFLLFDDIKVSYPENKYS